MLVTLAYLIATLFALTYNVGDPHVFFLPGHLLAAAAIAAALAPLRRPAPARRAHRAIHCAAAIAVLLYAGWRAWDTWPAADRSRDRRADALVARVAAGLSDENSILASQMDWQSENALLYSSRYERRDLAWTRLSDVLPYFPFLVRDNHAAGRDVVLTADAAADVVAAYGSFFPMTADAAIAPDSLIAALERLPRGTPFVVSLLTPPGDERFDPAAFDQALEALMAPASSAAAYQVWAGITGEAPTVHLAAERPFRQDFSLLGDRFTVRMDAWLPFDTFRRGGFGHVIGGREKVLAIERGASFVWFGRDGRASTAYLGGLYAPEPRFRIPAGATLELARLGSQPGRRGLVR